VILVIKDFRVSFASQYTYVSVSEDAVHVIEEVDFPIAILFLGHSMKCQPMHEKIKVQGATQQPLIHLQNWCVQWGKA